MNRRATDERLRSIARQAVASGVYSGNVKALRAVAASAWEEGARWAAVEFSGDDRYERGTPFLVPGENPYEEAQ